MTDAETALKDLLATGPRQSRDVTATMTRQGMTAKQVRRARERMGIVICRSGNGASMRSTWALPVEVRGTRDTSPALTFPDMPGDAAERKAKVSESQEPSGMATSTKLYAEETSRIARRVPVFMARGLDRLLATDVATSLVVQRDRPGTRAVSCVECQCYTLHNTCAAAQYTGGPRDAREVWSCGWARRDAP